MSSTVCKSFNNIHLSMETYGERADVSKLYTYDFGAKLLFTKISKNSWNVIQYVYDRRCYGSSQPSVQCMGNAIVGVDFEKAYGLINRDVLWRILKPDKHAYGSDLAESCIVT
ncbi:hypothetical protein OUZ56_024102 [Daphnia magna]|uniref:Reverse transcriptase domain-containing protein n=1 Tax=Daphnia magna TaxID=35525 RepID=A0ABR0B056_9CRUS|nr:hypothetical protein OUZ56_024102 [Daphnia magna]